MVAFAPGDVAAGGANEYILVYDKDGNFSQNVHVTDTGSITGPTGSGNQTLVTGLTFRPTNSTLFSTSTPSWDLPQVPHDCDWLPNDDGILVAVVPSTGSLLFRLYDFNGAILETWSPAVPAGFARQHVKISVACDSDTVLYTTQQRYIKRFSLGSGQLADYKVLPVTTPYLYGGIRVLPFPKETGDLRDLIVAMTKTGEGPRNAICLDSELEERHPINFWHDIVNPDADPVLFGSDYYIQKRDILTESTVSLTKMVETDSSGLVDEVLALACNFNPCAVRFTPERIYMSTLN